MSAKILFKKLIFLILILASVYQMGNSAHIVGADMTYRCTSPGEYEITLIVYRDCASIGAPFDSQSPSPVTGKITVFSDGGSTRLEDMIILDPPEIQRIDIEPQNPCQVVPSNLCVESGTYRFRVSLPVSDESYFLVYQRCCRNNTIFNIFDPGASGATYFVEITPLAQQLCIDSPVFDEFPPVLICNNFPFSFDHSASDNSDNTQLVYSFYNPFLGGGLGGSRPGDPPGAAFGPDGVAPQPAPFPPYNEVSFFPPYVSNNPLGGNPRVDINSSTGLISGTPNVSGQFVVGVQVQQFFNGQLVSTIRRDFQFNVSNCESLLEASVRSDDFREPDTYILNFCGELDVTIINQSRVLSGGRIDEVKWDFFLDNDTLTSTAFNGSFSFPDKGTYEGRLILNPGQMGCSDTAIIEVNLFPGIEAGFSFDYDTCSSGPVAFLDNSLAPESEIVSRDWRFKQDRTSSQTNPEFEFSTSGIKPVSLTITDDNGCEDTVEDLVPYFPLPDIIIVEPQKFIGCSPEIIRFTNLSEYLSDDYEITWSFGDGASAEGVNAEHEYETPGLYDILIEVVSPFGCEASRFFPSYIEILDGPTAGFSVLPEELNAFDPFVEIVDESMDGIGWQYNFNNETRYFDREPSHSFADSGFVFIKQIVFRENGCTDTAILELDLPPVVTFYLPNAFMPNGDGFNDVYKGKGVLDFMDDFSMQIFTRWGELVFETNDPRKGWNGKRFNEGEDMPQGVYVCLVTYNEPRGGTIVLREFATLIR